MADIPRPRRPLFHTQNHAVRQTRTGHDVERLFFILASVPKAQRSLITNIGDVCALCLLAQRVMEIKAYSTCGWRRRQRDGVLCLVDMFDVSVSLQRASLGGVDRCMEREATRKSHVHAGPDSTARQDGYAGHLLDGGRVVGYGSAGGMGDGGRGKGEAKEGKEDQSQRRPAAQRKWEGERTH
ncbi:hypothetical protein N658DRAFT_244815 [Parathielavia hyrcaniae]|uniref:Uncharacterized protein n=1 Tax=Parathielavia hyrcaniae TaxID=113614 RepID=A0AAN6T3W1_9PEZI|nr:hypothetical protein N658DRAFT_244815 [Parathielavia hyrcaniae]